MMRTIMVVAAAGVVAALLAPGVAGAGTTPATDSSPATGVNPRDPGTGGASAGGTNGSAPGGGATGGGVSGGGGAALSGPVSAMSQASGRCLDLTDGTVGAQVQIWDCDSGNPHQRWYTGGDNTVRWGGGYCLTLAGSGGDGTPVVTAKCDPGNAWAQSFSFNGNSDLIAVGPGKCVDVTDAGTANGSRLQVWGCTGAANQKWWHYAV